MLIAQERQERQEREQRKRGYLDPHAEYRQIRRLQAVPEYIIDSEIAQSNLAGQRSKQQQQRSETATPT